MKLETFFEKFALFADAPDAVAKMRELVWQLAVQGKLVPQDPAETHASALLGQILKAKANLPGNRRTSAQAEAVDLDGESAPYSAPSGWVWTPLGTVQVFTNGYAFKSEDYRESGVGIIRMGELGVNGEIDETNMKYVSLDIADLLAETFRVKPGDLLMGMSGSIGKLAINRSDKTYLLNQRVGRLEPVLIEKAFLQVFLKTVEQLYLRISFGMAIKNLSTKQINETPFPLPPLVEQKRIVAKVDELMALCDRLALQQEERETRHAALARASLARFAEAPTPANLQWIFHQSYAIPPAALRKAILTLAVQGKLVPQDPNDEPAETLLAAIASDVAKAMKAKRMRNSRDIAEYEGDDRFDLPIGWEWSQLGRITAAEDGAMCDGPFGSKLKTEHYIPSPGYAVVRLGNIGVGKFIWGKEGHISREHFESLPSNHTAPGDLLVAGLADPLIRCCEIPADLGPAVNKSDCFRVRLNPQMDRSYLRHFLNSPAAKAFAAEENHGMTRERINLANAKALPVPIPPLAEQRRIVAKVDELMALVDALETQLATARTTATALLAAALAELTNPKEDHAAAEV